MMSPFPPLLSFFLPTSTNARQLTPYPARGEYREGCKRQTLLPSVPSPSFPPTTLSDPHSTLPLSSQATPPISRQQAHHHDRESARSCPGYSVHYYGSSIKVLGSPDSGTIPDGMQPSLTNTTHHELVQLEIGIHSRHPRHSHHPKSRVESYGVEFPICLSSHPISLNSSGLTRTHQSHHDRRHLHHRLRGQTKDFHEIENFRTSLS